MKISVITVCHNSARTIRNTIESVLSQTHPDIEYIIIDGLSTDGTQDIIEEYRGQLASYTSEADNGIYDAMNKGITMATGDVIGILNADDIYSDDQVLSTIATAFESHDADAVYGDLVYIRPDNLNKVVRHYSSRRFAIWKLRFGWMPPHPATFFQALVYKKLGLYRTDYQISADYEFMVRSLYCAKIRHKWIDKTLVRMRTGGTSTRNIISSWRLNKEIVMACRENGVYTNMLFLGLKFPFKLMELIAGRTKRY